MRALIFYDTVPFQTINKYNEWAKDKPLTKDVIVHSHTLTDATDNRAYLVILVFFDEQLHPAWVGKNDTET